MLGLKELTAAIAKKECTVSDVIDQAIQRIQTYDATLHAFCLVDIDSAMEQAESLDRQIKAGSAVAVAAKMVPLALGSDGGGSIRIPVSLTGVFGMKPSWGRVPLYPSCRDERYPGQSGWESLEHIGPITRNAADAAFALATINGPSHYNRHSIPVESYDWSLRGIDTLQLNSIKDNEPVNINKELVYELISGQFPQWSNLAIHPVEMSGWDNRTFHLGDEMLVRLPSASHYASQVEKEQEWLPKLAPFLSQKIPTPLGLGKPTERYPWKWSVYRWIKGKTVVASTEIDLTVLAEDLANFLINLQAIDLKGGPVPGAQNFYRGGSVAVYDSETRQAISALNGKIDSNLVTEIWESGSSQIWQKEPVWVHGDISAGNLLINKGRLDAVIDFGQLCVGDPACDLVIAWTLFDADSRQVFHDTFLPDTQTWARARAWVLWKALIVMVNANQTNVVEAKQAHRTFANVLAEYGLNH